MNFFNDIKNGVHALMEAFRFIHRRKWYWFACVPALCMLLLYRLGFVLSGHELDLSAKTTNGITWVIIYGFLEIGLGVILMDFTKYLIVIVLSPLLTYLSATTDRYVTGKKQSFALDQFIHDIKRAVKLAFRNMLWQYTILAILFILGTIIWGKAVNSPLIAIMYLTSFFYYGFSFMDYSLERQKLSVNQSIFFVRKHRGLALFIGAVYSSLILVPVNLSILFALEDFQSTGFWNQLVEFCWHLLLWMAASFAPILVIVMATIAVGKANSPKK